MKKYNTEILAKKGISDKNTFKDDGNKCKVFSFSS